MCSLFHQCDQWGSAISRPPSKQNSRNPKSSCPGRHQQQPYSFFHQLHHKVACHLDTSPEHTSGDLKRTLSWKTWIMYNVCAISSPVSPTNKWPFQMIFQVDLYQLKSSVLGDFNSSCAVSLSHHQVTYHRYLLHITLLNWRALCPGTPE